MTATINYNTLTEKIKNWGKSLGFQQLGITDVDLTHYTQHFKTWLEKQFHGEMDYMHSHGEKRYRPDLLIPGTLRVISVRMNYLPANTQLIETLKTPEKAYVSRYALGRDYHKLIRKRLTQLTQKISLEIGPFGYRAFTDSAPVLEKPLAEKAGLGWIGKNANLINREAGSWFFLGEIYTDLPLPIDAAVKNHCGTCTACIDICPTQAIVGPYQLDARRCISYLTIELKGSIPVELRSAIGNRIYGCDDCQICCPWNRFAKPTDEKDFHPRHGLAAAKLIELFLWDENTFLKNTEGSAIRRIGYECWLRNLAIGLGNAPYSEEIIVALKKRQAHHSQLVREHVSWALLKQSEGRTESGKLEKFSSA